MYFSLKGFAAACLWLLLPFFPLYPQQPPDSSQQSPDSSQHLRLIIHRIADSSGPKPVQIESETPKVQIYRQDRGAWENVLPGIEILSGDSLRLDQYIHVEVLTGQTPPGRMILLPNVLQKKGLFAFQTPQIDSTDTSFISIIYGAMTVEWTGGELTVKAYGIDTAIRGTRVSFLNDPDSNRRLLFLESGAVFFPAYRQVTVTPPGVAHLHPQEGPVLLDFGPAQIARLEGVIKYNTEGLWERFVPSPWYKQPIFYIPAGLAAAAGGTYLITRPGDEVERTALPGPPALP